MMDFPENTCTAVFAGGCFWCTATDFESLAGVLAVVSGYIGGATANPTYHEVCSGRSGHLEAVQVYYDPDRVSYEALLERFWRMIDPTDAGGQFADRGDQYRPVIFYTTEAQRRTAQRSKAALERSGRFRRPIAVSIRPAVPFYPAERYHQGFYRKHPERYRGYKVGSGRAGYLQRHWGKGK